MGRDKNIYVCLYTGCFFYTKSNTETEFLLFEEGNFTLIFK